MPTPTPMLKVRYSIATESARLASTNAAARPATPPTVPLAAGETFSPQILNPPYTPKLQEITLDYAATTDTSRIDDPTEAAFTDTTLQFFHVDALGVAREHAWLDAARPWVSRAAVPLPKPPLPGSTGCR